MKKKIIFTSVIFIITFLFSTIIFFPYGKVAVKIVDNIIKERNINVKYNSLDISLFGATATKITADKLIIDKLTLKYNPIGLLFKRVSFEAESDFFTATGKLSGNDLNANIIASIAGITKNFGFSGGGRANADVEYNIKNQLGKATINSENISVKHPLMQIDAKNVTANADIKGNEITINEAKIEGNTSLYAKGKININPVNINHSIMDITGKLNIMGLSSNFRLSGNFISPKFSMN